MKSKIISVLGALLICFLTFSQAYRPMLAQFNEWHLSSCFSGCVTDVYYTDADTLIDGNTYSILDGYHYISRGFLLREDVDERKVYMRLLGIGKEDPEYLLYDFSLEVGDSMLIYNPITPLPDSAGYFIVDSIVPEVLIDGDTYRHFYLSASDSILSQSPRTEWIEGIGSLSLINSPGGQPDINAYGALSCFFNNLTLHYSNLDSITGCIQVNTDLSVNDVNTPSEFSVYPNPSNGYVNIKTSHGNIQKIVIHNILGEVVLSDFMNDSKPAFEFSTAFLGEGYYVLRVETDTGHIMTSRLIIE